MAAILHSDVLHAPSSQGNQHDAFVAGVAMLDGLTRNSVFARCAHNLLNENGGSQFLICGFNFGISAMRWCVVSINWIFTIERAICLCAYASNLAQRFFQHIRRIGAERALDRQLDRLVVVRRPWRSEEDPRDVAPRIAGG